MDKIDYDLTLEGDDLYYKNYEIWLKHHDNADCLIVKKDDSEFCKAEYKCPTREGFKAMKQVDILLGKLGR